MELMRSPIGRQGLLVGFLFSVLLSACAGFSYRFYGLDRVDYEQGTLTGPKPKNDLPFSSCAPNAQFKNPCVVMFAPEFFNLKADYEDTKIRLTECERGKSSN